MCVRACVCVCVCVCVRVCVCVCVNGHMYAHVYVVSVSLSVYECASNHGLCAAWSATHAHRDHLVVIGTSGHR